MSLEPPFSCAPDSASLEGQVGQGVCLGGNYFNKIVIVFNVAQGLLKIIVLHLGIMVFPLIFCHICVD